MSANPPFPARLRLWAIIALSSPSNPLPALSLRCTRTASRPAPDNVPRKAGSGYLPRNARTGSTARARTPPGSLRGLPRALPGRSARRDRWICSFYADHSGSLDVWSKRFGHAPKVVWYSGTTVKEYYRIVLCPADHKHRQPGSWRIHEENSPALSIFPTRNCGRSSGRSRFIGGTMNTSSLEFWFEFGSTYSYLSA